jgi:nitrate/nitrite-specific signal transduction histidine kinase
MKERAEFAGGRVTIKSTPGKGTRVAAEFKRTRENPLWIVRQSDRRKGG